MILGLDLSLTSTGWCVYNEDTGSYITGIIPTTKKEPHEKRMNKISDEIIKLVIFYNPNLIVIEGLVNKSFQAATLGGVGWHVRCDLERRGAHFVDVPPKSLKLFITGNGNAGKPLMAKSCKEKWKVEFFTSDECDAYCLCRYGETMGESYGI